MGRACPSQNLARYFVVTGVDFSEKQVELAKKHVPGAEFLCQDITGLSFPDDSFDAICSYYAIIHIPRPQHKAILEKFYRMLKRNGLALVCLGAGDLPEDRSEFHGVEMYWSHYDKDIYLAMLRDCGYGIIWSKLVKDASYDGTHLFVLAEKRA